MSRRMEKVASLLQQELGAILEKEYPRGGPLLTVVEVKITADLGLARAFVSIIGNEEERAETMEFLNDETKNIRRILSSKIRHQFRRIPELEFREDLLYEKASRIEELLRGVRKESGENE
ncbi:30S ribosome-binding factor RbfA [Chlorobium phaeovibrioides]|uniref:Ribosome-binding factor A n=1 Tax=Chlorobium phaeovibrioides TaxID=1094 RepID=A0A3S0L688_CHLPH|nr:30S ribosome-binding factor RbfA [Chlorobium phaeovibrioides]KAA6230620.1 30S ribosome-binding factor RbfA [Chlorobium phaeovibrioides]MWV54335.1 30S ribosome-binding factor RbfA [Chlorobium phaeovibrioides]RTY35730.1 30S ribosome-binding factor RbfA [Chlorobium phaeovibrioides]RTY39046.1 30S ribosome-binding factor RbfA [Chlorobium phaeovibrioides]